jgi:hypothetical protein
MTPMPRELRSANVDRDLPVPAGSDSPLTVRRLREGVDRWQTPVPDNAILLTPQETAHAIESFASETVLHIPDAADADVAAGDEGELPLFTAERVTHLTIVQPIDAVRDLRAVADDAGVITVAPLAPRSMNGRFPALVGAAALLGAVLGIALAFRTDPRQTAGDVKPAAPPPVVSASANFLSSSRAPGFVPLATGVAPQQLRTDASTSTDRAPSDPPGLPHPATGEAIAEPAQSLAVVQSRRPDVLTEPAVVPILMPAPGIETKTAIAPENDAPAARPPAVAALTPPSERAADPRTSPVRPIEATRGDGAANSAIAAVLDRYRTAFNDLNAEAARSVWPGADVKGLGRAFGALKEQQLSFDDCAITLRGDSAVADCRGTASYVPKVGRKAQRVEARQWRFQVEKRETGWLIQSVAAR